MAFSDNSDTFASFHEEGFKRIIEHIRLQRSSLFNYGTADVLANRELCCKNICKNIKGAPECRDSPGLPYDDHQPAPPIARRITMARFGVEAIRHFGNARANGVSTAEDLTYTFNRSNGFANELSSAGHTQAFYWAEQDCWENDVQDTDFGGDDRSWFDDVDICWIETHGNHTSDGQARMLYDINRSDWRTFSGTWRLGENWNAEWIMAFSCKTAALATITGLWQSFEGLHLYCGAYDNMYDGYTTDECGEDVADNLTDGDTVCEAWIDGVSDWWVDNHPVVAGPGDAATWNDGNIRWDFSAHNRDHLHGHGGSISDLPPSRQACFLWRWAEG